MRLISTLLDNKLKSDEEYKPIAPTQQIEEPQPEHTHHAPFDEELFTNLDEKIRKGTATDAEDDTYAKLLPNKTEQQVQDYHCSPEELKQKFEEH